MDFEHFNFNMAVATLNDVDKLLLTADRTLLNGRRSAAIIGKAHIDILMAHPHMTFSYLETRYRYFSSNTCLLSAPLNTLPTNATARHPFSKKPAEYYVWIGVNGRLEVKRKMRRFFKDYDEEENLKRLATAGMIFLNEVPSN